MVAMPFASLRICTASATAHSPSLDTGKSTPVGVQVI
jgi:hypothetical protein